MRTEAKYSGLAVGP